MREQAVCLFASLRTLQGYFFCCWTWLLILLKCGILFHTKSLKPCSQLTKEPICHPTQVLRMVHSSHPYLIKPRWHLDSSVTRTQSHSLTLTVCSSQFCWDQNENLKSKSQTAECGRGDLHTNIWTPWKVLSLSVLMHLLALAVCVFLFVRVALPFPSSSVTPLPPCVLLWLDGPEFGRGSSVLLRYFSAQL